MHLWAERICRWSVAGFLIAAAVAKSVDLNTFARTIGDFGLLWPAALRPTAILVCVLESLAGLLLLARHKAGIYLAGSLLLLFTAVIAYGLWLGLDIECGCLGPAGGWSGTTLKTSLLRNLVLLAALAYVWRRASCGG